MANLMAPDMRIKIKNNFLLICFSLAAYLFSIATGAELYLPYQIEAYGFFDHYSFDSIDFLGIVFASILIAFLIPKNFNKPSDWYLLIFNIFIFSPSIVLVIGSENLGGYKKITLIISLIISMIILKLAGSVRIGKKTNFDSVGVNIPSKNIIKGAMYFWLLFFVVLVFKYSGDMKFSGIDEIYNQRELTSDVGGVWGYIQLYFNFFFSTILIAYSLSINKWKYFIIGSSGYFLMYLITAEKSQLMFPLMFVLINYLVKKQYKPQKTVIAIAITFSLLIFCVAFFSESNYLFNRIGHFLFARLIATPGQFILDYYNFFSTNGYTYFSHIRGFNLLINPPENYASHPKWPQLGWIVANDLRSINSNSNASLFASDGAASMGIFGIFLITLILVAYLVIINSQSYKFPKIFWSVIFTQQAFLLTNGSFFTVLLSFGGLLYLALFIFYNPKIGREE